jgi:cytochrome b561
MEKKFTLLYRIWHWTMALSVIGLLVTVLLRKTFLSWRTNSEIIMTKFQDAGLEVTTELAKATAKAIRSGMWEWHYIFGLFLGISILIRIYMILSKKAILPVITLIQAPKEKKLQYGVYTLLCFFIMIMTLSGGFLYFYEIFTFTKDEIHLVKEIHEVTMWGIVVFVTLHLAGVLKHEFDTKEPIVSKMIHGD